jgi:hypothetical protein
MRGLLNEGAGGRRKLGRIALRETHPDHEVRVFSISEGLETVAQTDDARGRSPGFRQRPDLHHTAWLRGAAAAEEPGDGEADREHEET